LQFHICLAVLYKIICLQFSYAFFCLFFSFIYVFVTRESSSLSVSPLWCFLTQYSKSVCSRNPWSLQLASAVIVTRSDRGIEQERVHWNWHLQKALTNPWFRKQGSTLASFILLSYQKIFMPKNLSLKLIYICTDDQGTFWLVFAFYFTSCYNSRIHYRNLECHIKRVWLFNRDQNFRGINFMQNN